MRAGVTNGSPNRATFVAAKIVENDDVARAQRRDQELLHPSQEQLAVDRAVKDANAELRPPGVCHTLPNHGCASYSSLPRSRR